MGVREVGLDLYATASGAGNRYDSLFRATIADMTIANGDVSQYPDQPAPGRALGSISRPTPKSCTPVPAPPASCSTPSRPRPRT